MTYREEADALDAEILHCIEILDVPDFNSLALRIFAHQLRYNLPYARYCASLCVTPDAMPESWEAIPAVPATAFKEAALCTFDPANAALAFETSGTTRGVGGKHYMENAALYDAALLAGFHEAMLGDAREPLRYLLLVPNPVQRPQSSLGYMMRKVARSYSDAKDQWYLDGDTLDTDRFISDVRTASTERAAVCVAGTAFALVQLLDALHERGLNSLPLPAGSRIMETGGFKGRTRVVSREELYADLSRLLAIPEDRIIAEYGMTELTSQYYDVNPSMLQAPPIAQRLERVASPAVAGIPQDDKGVRIKKSQPWLRPRVVGPDGKTLPTGVVGALVHVDLANRSSCVAVHTEDLGVAMPGGIVLIGREQGAELRGCSLDVEQLRTLAAR